MRNRLSGLLRALLVLAVLASGAAAFVGTAYGSDVRLAALEGVRPLFRVPEVEGPMTPLPKAAQARCPGGQLVFLSRACGCNGACCLCSRQTPYLNHCTCRCEAVPTPCAQGHSAGRP
jgi:hypothetical protein